MQIKSYKLFDWLEKEDFQKITDDLKNGKKPEISFYVEDIERDFSVEIYKMTKRMQQYHIYGRVVSGLHEGYDVHIQYDETKRIGELTIK